MEQMEIKRRLADIEDKIKDASDENKVKLLKRKEKLLAQLEVEEPVLKKVVESVKKKKTP